MKLFTKYICTYITYVFLNCIKIHLHNWIVHQRVCVESNTQHIPNAECSCCHCCRRCGLPQNGKAILQKSPLGFLVFNSLGLDIKLKFKIYRKFNIKIKHFWPHRFYLNFRKLLNLSIFVFCLVNWTYVPRWIEQKCDFVDIF